MSWFVLGDRAAKRVACDSSGNAPGDGMIIGDPSWAVWDRSGEEEVLRLRFCALLASGAYMNTRGFTIFAIHARVPGTVSNEHKGVSPIGGDGSCLACTAPHLHCSGVHLHSCVSAFVLTCVRSYTHMCVD